MKYKYIIKEDIIGRIATNFVFKINEIKGSIFITNINKLSCNAKSLIGILGLHLKKGEEVEVLILDTEDYKNIKKIFEEIGDEVNGL